LVHVRGLDAGLSVFEYQRSGALEPEVQVDCTDDGLVGVCQEGFLLATARLVLPAAETQGVTDASKLRERGERPRVDDPGAPTAQLALRGVRIAVHQRFGNDESDDCVPQELESLVVRDAGCSL
jgi:hypothetical protein